MSSSNQFGQKAGTFSTTRPSCVAGRHYPEDPDRLAEIVDILLASVEPVDGEPTILIAPHGRYALCGAVAAQAYRQVQGVRYDVIVIIGHRLQGTDSSGFAVWTHGPWQTPLGLVPTDQVLARNLVEMSSHFGDEPTTHFADNSIEAQLPFIQRTCLECPIVPIVVGDPCDAAIDQCADALAKILAERKALIIVSSNLCQYPAYDDARRVDNATLFAIETGDADHVARSIDYALSLGIPGLERCVCRDKALLLALKLADLSRAEHVRILGSANSGDSSEGDRSRVEGYAALMFWHWEPIKIAKNDEEVLLQLVRESIAAELSGAELPDIASGSSDLQRRSAAFVTLRLSGMLRGCTGDVSGKRPLGQAIQHAAITAAFCDPRFPPLTLRELEEISIEISVLSPMKRVSDPEMIDVGVHGLVLRSGRQGGLLLPQVALDRDWDRAQFLAAVCRKAGLRESAWRTGALLYTFTAQVFGDE